MIEKQTGYFNSFDDTSIYYEVRGKGKPIFLAYGIVCLINHWRYQLKYFSENYQTIVIDFRGHHKSKAPTDRGNLTVDAVAQDIVAACEHLNIRSACFFGHSFGVQCLVRAYELKPKLVSSLVFVNGFATNPIKGFMGLDSMDSVIRLAKQAYELLPESISYLWGSILNNPLAAQIMSLSGGFNLQLTSAKDIQVYLRGVKGVELEIFLSLFESMMNYDGNSVLEKISCPTLVIGGAKDQVTPLKFQEAIHHKIKDSKMQVIPYGTHCSQLDMPDLVNLRIEKFLKNINYA